MLETMAERWNPTSRQLVLAGADDADLTSIAAYRETGGFQALAKARSLKPEAVIDTLLASNLRGRGGAFFAMGRKASFIPMTASSEPTIAIRSATAASVMQAAVACNAANEGARNLTRHGFGPPSETR